MLTFFPFSFLLQKFQKYTKQDSTVEPRVLTHHPASAITNPGPIVLPLDPFIPLPHVWLCYLETENSFLISVYKKYLIFNLRTEQNSLTLMFFSESLESLSTLQCIEELRALSTDTAVGPVLYLLRLLSVFSYFSKEKCTPWVFYLTFQIIQYVLCSTVQYIN